jgi:hypothetical protein
VEDAVTWLAEQKKFGSPREKAQEWLADLERWELLLRRGSGNEATYEFAIPTLDEYFTARHLAARWAEEDERYRTWLPCSEGWWERGGELRCPNLHCRITLPPFRELLRQAGYEETLLLMVGLLKEAEREKIFLNDIYNNNLHFDAPRRYRNFVLKALGRCRHVHAHIGQGLPARTLLGLSWYSRALTDGFAALGTARVHANLDPILNHCVCALHDKNRWRRKEAARVLAQISNARAVEPLIAALKDEDWRVREGATDALGQIGDARAVEPLIAALKDEDEWVREELP